MSLPIALAGLALTVALAVLTWLASLLRNDVSLVDRVWSLLIVGAGWTYAALTPGLGERGLCMLLLASLWALRLGLFITWRNWGHGEERRYREIRERNQPGFRFKSLYLVFLLQAVLAWTVSAPFLAAVATPPPWRALDGIGLALAAFGLVFETVGDAQMARFKADPAHRGQVMDRGLWRYTRHPNYFGEACLWWGLWLMAMAGGTASAAESNVSAFLDGKPIGEHRFVVSGSADAREVRSDARFAVKLLGLTVYRYRHQAVEQWRGDCLGSLNATTDDDGTVSRVRTEPASEGLSVMAQTGTGAAPQVSALAGCVMSFAYWNPALRQQRRLLNAQTGKAEAVRVSRAGSGPIEVRGQPVAATRWRIEGPPQAIDVWYSAEGEWVGLDSTLEGERQLTYRLQ